jgi:hypothetical protein
MKEIEMEKEKFESAILVLEDIKKGSSRQIRQR